MYRVRIGRPAVALRVLLGSALGVLAGCGGAREPPPHVLLISLDALRADHLSGYGYGRPTSPFLDELAARGVRFEQTFVATHGTTPSHTTMLSGLYQETHRVAWAESGEPAAIPETVPLVQEVLRDAGWVTLASTGGGNAGGKLGFRRGFDAFDDRGRGVEDVTGRALALLEEHLPAGKPVFLFVHTYEVHSPYRPPAGYADLFTATPELFDASSENLLAHVHTARRTLSREELEVIRALYDGGLRYTDDVLRRFFARLDELGFLARAQVWITADHGEELGEHGGLLHRDLLYEELLRVPLIAAGPGLPAGRVEAGLASAVDVAPSLLAAAGVEIPAWMEGRDLVSTPAPRLVFAQYSRRRYAVRSARWKLIETVEPPRLELYDLDHDPAERRNRAAEEPETAARLLRTLAAWKAARKPITGDAPKAVELTEEERRQLEALGYL